MAQGSQALLRISGIQLRYGLPGPASLEPLCLLMVRLSGTYLRYGVPGLARRLLLSPRVMGPVRHYNLYNSYGPRHRWGITSLVSRVAQSCRWRETNPKSLWGIFIERAHGTSLLLVNHTLGKTKDKNVQHVHHQRIVGHSPICESHVLSNDGCTTVSLYLFKR